MVDSSTYLPQDIERRQKMAEALLYGAMKPRTIHNVGEGIAQMGQALLGGLMTRKANEAEASGRKSASDAVARALGGFSAPSDGLPQVAPVATPTQPQTISGASPDFTSLYENADKQIGIPGFAERVAQVESSGNPNARNPNSSAGGLYQFIDSTAKQYGLDNKFDPAAATDAFARLTLDNKAALTKALGREPTAGELYLAHQQGAGGAAKLILAGNAPAASVVGADAANLNGGRGASANDLVDRWTSKFADMNPASVTSNPVQRGTLTPSPGMVRPLGQNADMTALPTAEPVALNRTMPMAQALANPTAPVAIPDNNPLRSNQQQSAGDFARADARRRMAMAMSGGQMPSAPPPMAGNVPSAPVSRPSPVMGAPMQTAPQQAPQAASGGNRLQALMAAAQNPYLTAPQASLINTMIDAEMKRNAPQEPKIVTAPDGTILAINPRDTTHPQTVYRSGGYRPMTSEEKASFGVPADQAAFMGPDGKPQALGKGGITINNNPEASMFAGLPKDVRAEMFKRQGEAQDASDLVGVTNQGLQLLDAGAITGAGSTGRIAALKWAQTLGIPVPEDTAAAINNTEAYRAIMAKAVGKVIKNFGSGTGLSDADRQYAERLAGGDTTLNEPAIRRILAAGVTQAHQKIKNYETMRDKVLSGDLGALLNVPEPQAYTAPTAQPAAPQAQQTAPAAPPPGTVMDGYRFKGGDPSDKNNWQQVY